MRHLRQLSSKKVTTGKKRKILQAGGFLSDLLAPLVGSIQLPLLREVVRAVV